MKFFPSKCCIITFIIVIFFLTSCSVLKSKIYSSSEVKSKTVSSSTVENEIFTASQGYSHPKLFNKDDSVDFTFCGHKYNIPNSKLSEFKNNGITAVDNELTANIKPKNYYLSWRNKDKSSTNLYPISINLNIANFTNQMIKPENGNVCEVSFLTGWISDSKNYILPQGITIGSTIQQVRSIYSAPESIKIGSATDTGDYISYEYHQGNTIVSLFFDRRNYTLINLSIDATPMDYTLTNN